MMIFRIKMGINSNRCISLNGKDYSTVMLKKKLFYCNTYRIRKLSVIQYVEFLMNDEMS